MHMATEAEMRAHRCCFTGHRPEKLLRGEAAVKADLRDAIEDAVKDGFSVFISGMARGVDLWAADIVLAMREEGIPVRLICASPYVGFEKGWSEPWQARYRQVLQTADLVRFVQRNYTRNCFQKRNEWMVNHAGRVIAVYNGQPSGTKNTIVYAQRMQIPVHLIQG